MSTNLYAFAVQPYDTATGTSAFVRLSQNGQVGRVSYQGGWIDLYLYPPGWRSPGSASKADWENAFPKHKRFLKKHVDCETPGAKTACRGLITGMLSQWIEDFMGQATLEVQSNWNSMDASTLMFDARVTPRNGHLFCQGNGNEARNGELRFLVPHFCSLSEVSMAVSGSFVDVTKRVIAQHTLHGNLYRIAVPLVHMENGSTPTFKVTVNLPAVEKGACLEDWAKQFEGQVVRVWTEWTVGDEPQSETKRSFEERIRMRPSVGRW